MSQWSSKNCHANILITFSYFNARRKWLMRQNISRITSMYVFCNESNAGSYDTEQKYEKILKSSIKSWYEDLFCVLITKISSWAMDVLYHFNYLVVSIYYIRRVSGLE